MFFTIYLLEVEVKRLTSVDPTDFTISEMPIYPRETFFERRVSAWRFLLTSYGCNDEGIGWQGSRSICRAYGDRVTPVPLF